ncbi:MAG: benzoate-CoA ligase family protein [Acidimicrobiales bacterium]
MSNISPADCNLATYFIDNRLAAGEAARLALVAGTATVSYGELADLVNRTGNGLLGLGVAQGERVLLAVSDGVEFVAIWYACQKLGLVTAECYTFLQPKDYAYYLSYTQARVVFVDSVTLEPMRQAASLAPAPAMPRSTVAVGVAATELRPGEVGLTELAEQAPSELAPARVGPEDIAVWKFTTGSTGSPKACVHPASHPIASHHAYAVGVLAMQPSDRVLAVPKLFFGYARDLACLYPFGVGASGIVFPERSTVERIFELIRAHRPTILVNVPTMIGAMVAHPGASSQDLSCLRVCTSAGEALPAELQRRWLDTFGVEVLDGIGSSEAYHIYISNRPGRVRPGTVGEPVPGYTARVVPVDATGPALPDGDVGRLSVTGPTIALEYHGDAERSRATYHGDTVVSEDLFIRQPDGYFSYVGRADDLLKISGIWVAPAEIEQCLLAHPSVLECAVLGYEVEGLVKPLAYVVLVDGPEAGDWQGGGTGSAESEVAFVADLQSHVRSRLAGYKVPRQVRVVPELPKTANGKIDRKALGSLKGGAPAASAGVASPPRPAS